MHTEISRTFRFEAAHRLPHVPASHKCARLHGHSYRVTVVVTGPINPRLGWIVDFEALDEAWKPLHAQLDHHFLNEVSGLENPTSERLAAWIVERYTVDSARVVSLTVHETPYSSCTIYPDTL